MSNTQKKQAKRKAKKKEKEKEKVPHRCGPACETVDSFLSNLDAAEWVRNTLDGIEPTEDQKLVAESFALYLEDARAATAGKESLLRGIAKAGGLTVGEVRTALGGAIKLGVPEGGQEG